VQRALAAGHPEVASAIAFAIAAQEPDPKRKDALMAMLKIDMKEIGTALRTWGTQREAAKAAP
jgi:hypothetical protein